MRRNPALSVLGLATMAIAIVCLVVLLFVLVFNVGMVLHEHFREFFNQPFPPMTLGQALATAVVLVILLSFRR